MLALVHKKPSPGNMFRTDSYEVIKDEESRLGSPAIYRDKASNYSRRNDYIVYESEDMPTRNIVYYDTSRLLNYGWLFPVRGSIFTWHIMLWVTIQLVLSTALAFVKCGVADEHFCVPLPDSMTGLTLITITSFLVGIFSNSLMQRWWNIRVAMALVMNKSKALTTAIVSVVAVSSKYASPRIREEALRAVHTVKRYLCLAHALIYKNANGTSDVSDLIGRGLLTQGEAAILIGADTHAGTLNRSLGRVSPGQAYSWANMTMERIGAAGLLGPALDSSAHHMVSFFSDLSVIQAAACDVSMYVDVQLPYPFVQMTVVLVYAFLAQLMIVTAGLIGYGLETNDSSYVVTGYITSLLLSFVLLGILQMYDMLSNPLGEDPADFPVSTYMHEGEAEVDDLVNGIWSASIAAGAGGIIPDVRIKPADLRSGGSTPLKK